MKSLIIAFFSLASVQAQQQSDNSFQFEITHPAYPVGSGPRICFDEGHYNYHTADGRYKPFADMLRQDGFQIFTMDAVFSSQALINCDALIIANALDESNQNNW